MSLGLARLSSARGGLPSVSLVTILGLNEAKTALRCTAPPNWSFPIKLGTATIGTVTADGAGTWSFTPAPAPASGDVFWIPGLLGAVLASFTVPAGVVPDIVPDAFSFTDLTAQALSSVITGAAVTITGINAATPFTVTGCAVRRTAPAAWSPQGPWSRVTRSRLE